LAATLWWVPGKCARKIVVNYKSLFSAMALEFSQAALTNVSTRIPGGNRGVIAPRGPVVLRDRPRPGLTRPALQSGKA